MDLTRCSSGVCCRLVPRVDTGDILGEEVTTVETLVASIYVPRAGCEGLISSDSTNGVMDVGRPGGARPLQQTMVTEGVIDSYNGASEVVEDSDNMPFEDMNDVDVREDVDVKGVVVSKLKGSCWT